MVERLGGKRMWVSGRGGSTYAPTCVCMYHARTQRLGVDRWVEIMLPLPPKGIRALPDEFCIQTKRDVLVCKWHWEWQHVSANKNGVTGWATVARALNGTIRESKVVRSSYAGCCAC